MIWKVYRKPGNFINSPKITIKSGKFTDNLEPKQVIKKLSGQSGKFIVNLESSRQSGNLPDNIEKLQIP